MSEDGATLKVTTAPPDRVGLRSLVRQIERDCGTEEVGADSNYYSNFPDVRKRLDVFESFRWP